MGCNCKAESTDTKGVIEQVDIKESFGKYTLKFLGLLLFIISLPIINVMIIWFVFKTLLLNRNVDLKPMLLSILSKFKSDDDDDDDDYEYYDLTEDDVELMGVEEITLNSNK